MYVSEIENIWKESQEVYDANQRELNCLQLELVKSENKLLYDYFFSEGNAIYSSSQLVWILMIAITLWFEKVFSDLISVDQCTENEGIFFMLLSAVSDIDNYTKLWK